ncbi:bifunctional metallophosphatase/5'-nucleotidase [Pseudalkalibacillus caeni]|uniref:Bifunctional metallophosphatase/5'-nucleotidase n=1 Tax=Exobacillus caeni TaxID=2574798 RepID=A0A5R9FAY4_9BACL|nr:bifunctional UDP-sugar hydrolase/5'-nucleotidase [Pseudalkalibacillus caeni]TLS38818.1 bifunctional metallophosphatase/5'-nucleotidase [Pseudalkalibacillus caeni]
MSIKTLHVYSTNDLHSHFSSWPKVASFLKNERKFHELQGDSVLLFDIGDHADRVHPMTEGTGGKGNVVLLNELNYDDVTIGNNEGITFSKEELDQMYQDATFSVLVSNLYDESGKRPDWVKPYRIHEMKNGLSVGVIGITVPYHLFYQLLGWKIVDPLSILQDIVNEVKEKADIVILLSHMGLFNDEEIADQVEGIDLILGAHTHHLIHQGKNVKGTLIAQSGKDCQYVGQVKIAYDSTSGEVVEKEAYSVSVERMKPDSRTVQLINELETNAASNLGEVITELKETMKISWDQPSPFSKELASALKEWCNAEIGMVNAGLLLEDLQAGEVTRLDLHRVCPHPINPCMVKLKGREIKEIAAQAVTSKMVNLEFKGLGFRGKVMGVMVYDGLEVETRVLDDGLIHVKAITRNGEPLEMDREYTVATVDMFTFGQFYPEIKHAQKDYYLPEMLRDVLAWHLRQESLLNRDTNNK